MIELSNALDDNNILIFYLDLLLQMPAKLEYYLT